MPDRERYLATTEWLARNLGSPDLCVLECTVFLRPREDGRPGFLVLPGNAEWAMGHIPGSVFADLHHDLSDRAHPLRFMMPPAGQFAEAMERYGVGDGSQVVLYDRAGNMWAARIWWMLRAFGFDNARILDGGWSKWIAEGRPVSNEPPRALAARFTAKPRPGLIATKDEVLAAQRSGQACIVNALNAAQHRGEVAPYGRAGRIAGSVNVPAMGSAGVVDPETQLYHAVDEIRRRFETAGASPGARLITYCGGGIAASSAAFAATMAGYPDVAVYDASLSEWAADPSLPMETG
jgi:thiosulfate/3-mercaptopyruvate sulfurtransferase